MSRVGNAPIEMPSGVELSVKGSEVEVKGPKGTLTQAIDPALEVSVEDGTVTIARSNDERQTRALHGLSRALINNMVTGVSEGFSKELTIVGVGYRAALKGKDLEIQVGYSHPVVIGAVDGIDLRGPREHEDHRVRYRQAEGRTGRRRTSERCARPSPTRARASATRTSTCDARQERQV